MSQQRAQLCWRFDGRLQQPLQRLVKESVHRTPGRGGWGQILRSLLIAGFALLLTGCGFHLRGAVDIPARLEPVYIQFGGLVGQAIEERLRGSDVAVTHLATEAGLILRFFGQSRSSRVVAVDREGKALAYALEFRVGFNAVDASGQQLIPEQRLTLERTFDDNPDVAVLGKQLESDIIYQDMADDAADQVLLRLRAALAAHAQSEAQAAPTASSRRSESDQ